MSQRTQTAGILACRFELDDAPDGKTIFQFQPLQGAQDGANVNFEIPQSRVVVQPPGFSNIFPTIYINEVAIPFPANYTMLNVVGGYAKQGLLQFTTNNQPKVTDSVKVTFNWVWFDDVELDAILNRAANEVGFTVYYTQSSGIGEAVPQGGTLPTDIPDGLYNAIIKLAVAAAASALAKRFSMKYDFGAGDQSFSPSQMASSFKELAETAKEEGLNARDDFYKGQGRQYQPASAQQGYILPNWTPPR